MMMTRMGFVLALIGIFTAAPLLAATEDATTAELDPTYPAYQQTRPQWAVEIAGSGNALGGRQFRGEKGGLGNARGLSLQFEYQPAFLQSYGIFGIGPSAALYPILPNKSVTPSLTSSWSFGGQFRYQARYLREQPVVPMIGYSVEAWRYKLNSRQTGMLVSHGPMAGVWVLLNWIDSKTAGVFYTNQGVSRTYLTAEVRRYSGGNDDRNYDLSGLSYFFGLRFEI